MRPGLDEILRAHDLAPLNKVVMNDSGGLVEMIASGRKLQGETFDPPGSLFMVFDVESIGLHGEGFSVAWVVVNRNGDRLEEECLSCDPGQCHGTEESRLWVSENVPPLKRTSQTKQHLRNAFWHSWRYWADRGAVLVADCAWPVEANFLNACIALNPAEREWQGPYPLHDLASVLLTLGDDPLAVSGRLPDELPAHHPLMDARQSARQLVFSLQRAEAIVRGVA